MRGASATQTIFGFYSRKCRLSAPPVTLVDRLMCIDTKRRWGVRDAIRHEWVRAVSRDVHLCDTSGEQG